jgi:hypothetical protein
MINSRRNVTNAERRPCQDNLPQDAGLQRQTAQPGKAISFYLVI